MKVSDLVLIEEGIAPQLSWKKLIVNQSVTGCDDLVRVAITHI